MADRFDKFTERARQVLSMAYQEAQDFGQSGIDTEHILLAIIDAGEGVAVRLLFELGGRLPPIRQAVVTRIDRGQGASSGGVGLTPRAKQVIELAVDEARRLHHHYVGDEHLLLGLTRVAAGIAAQVLSEFGIDHDRAVGQMIAIQSAGAQQADWISRTPHLIRNPVQPPSPEVREAMAQLEQLRQQEHELQRRISQMLRAARGSSGQAPPGAQPTEPIDFDRFTEQARRVLVYSQEEAQRFNHNYIGTEHLLLGVTRDPDTVAARALKSFGGDLAKVRSAVEFIIGRGMTAIIGQIGLTPRSQQALAHAVDEAHRLDHTYIGPEHLLLGLSREGEGIAAGVLASMGVHLDQLRTRVSRLLTDEQAPPQAPRATTAATSLQPPMLTPEEIAAINTARGRLLQVIPIVQEQTQDDTTLIGIAIERYEQSFVATWQFTTRRVAPPSSSNARLRAEDDRGTAYRSVADGGGGSYSVERGGEWRFAHRFFPPLHPAARSLTFTVTTPPGNQPDASPVIWNVTVAIPTLPGS